MLALILSFLGIVVGFFVLELGFVFEIISFFVAKKQMKNKEKYYKYAYYISLVVGVLQFIIWVVVMAYTFIFINNLNEEANNILEEINNKYELEREYYDNCGDKNDKSEDYYKCINSINECFDKYEQLDEVKQCVEKMK